MEPVRIVEVDCTDAEAVKGCRECGGEIIKRHWATLPWAAANWYCSRECADAVELRSKVHDQRGEGESPELLAAASRAIASQESMGPEPDDWAKLAESIVESVEGEKDG